MEDLNTRNEEFLRHFMANQRKIHAYILMYVPNLSDADDLLQQTAVVLWNKFDSYNSNKSFSGWGIGIARNEILKLQSQKKHARVRFDSEMIHILESKAENLAEKSSQYASFLQHCLKKLDPQKANYLTLRYEKGLAINQIAEEIGKSAHSMYKTIGRIHKQLSDCVRQQIKLEQ